MLCQKSSIRKHCTAADGSNAEIAAEHEANVAAVAAVMASACERTSAIVTPRVSSTEPWQSPLPPSQEC